MKMLHLTVWTRFYIKLQHSTKLLLGFFSFFFHKNFAQNDILRMNLKDFFPTWYYNFSMASFSCNLVKRFVKIN